MRRSDETGSARNVGNFRLIGEVLFAVHIPIVAIDLAFEAGKTGNGLLGVKAAGIRQLLAGGIAHHPAGGVVPEEAGLFVKRLLGADFCKI